MARPATNETMAARVVRVFMVPPLNVEANYSGELRIGRIVRWNGERSRDEMTHGRGLCRRLVGPTRRAIPSSASPLRASRPLEAAKHGERGIDAATSWSLCPEPEW